MTEPLVIELSKESVHIPKFQLEVPFCPPDPGLTRAAQETYQILKTSLSLQGSISRDQRGEVMTLLQQFGKGLYKAVFPVPLQARLPKEGPVYIRALDDYAQGLPWELLYDGASFLAQTHGVLRLYRAKYIEPNPPVDAPKQHLRFALCSHDPLDESFEQGCVVAVEVFSLLNRESHQETQMLIDGDANGPRLLKKLELGPELFLFSGSGSRLAFELAGEPLDDFEDQFFQALEKGVRKGLRLLILLTADLLTKPAPMVQLGTTGLPLAITIHGRIESARLLEYFSALLSALGRGSNLLKAHRHAINQIQAALPLSWDWSWIQLHIAKEYLAHSIYDPLRPFVFSPREPEREDFYDPNPSLLNGRCFMGNKGVLGQLIRAMLSGPEQGVIWLRSSHGGWQEEYALEFFRRLAPRADFSLQVLYYFRWGSHQGQNTELQDAQLQEAFGFLWDEAKLADYFEDSLLTLRMGQEADQRYLMIYYPPDQVAPLFEAWLLDKKEQGFRIILLGARSSVSELSTQVISTDICSLRELEAAYPEQLSEKVQKAFSGGSVNGPWKNRSLLHLLLASQKPGLLSLLDEKKESAELWAQVFEALYQPLSTIEKKLVATLYLLKVKWPRESLEQLLGDPRVAPSLQRLYEAGLLEKNLEGSLYWLAGQLFSPIQAYGLLAEQPLIKTAQELLQQLNGPFDHLKLDPVLAVSGVGYLLNELAKLGAVETALHRGIQFARRVAGHLADRPHRLGQLLLGCVKLASTSKQDDALEKVFSAMLEVLEYLDLQEQTIRLYEWFLTAQQQRRNWVQVAALQTRLAKFYAQQGQVEQARGHLVTATQLSLDVVDPTQRAGLLVELALAMAELGELEKLDRLLDNAGFEPSLLSQQAMARLWLIDGHLLAAAGEAERALVAFKQAFTYKHDFINDRMAAKTERALAKLYQDRSDLEEALKHWALAAHLFEKTRDLDQAETAHQNQCELYFRSHQPTEAIDSLAWLYQYAEQTGQTQRARSIADELGGLYYKVGNRTQSTEFYKKAQELVNHSDLTKT